MIDAATSGDQRSQEWRLAGTSSAGRGRIRFRVRRAGVGLGVMFGFMSSAWGSPCVEVKGWDTLDDPVRLCAYLSDPDEAEACERRGYRLGDGLTESDIDIVRQFVLLCSNEYVIGIKIESVPDSSPVVLAVTTAIVDGVDAAAGYYDHGRVRILAADGRGWSQRSNGSWSE